EYVQYVILIVLLHNAIAILSGYGLARVFRLPGPDQKTLAIETGIQNSGLGLGLIFAFFDGLGGMAIVAGWWGIWHIISGLSLAYFFKRREL
ncbi:MAG: bile acid:sodium symporter family protein, partial [Cyclobacteriaceae bacterium]